MPFSSININELDHRVEKSFIGEVLYLEVSGCIKKLVGESWQVFLPFLGGWGGVASFFFLDKAPVTTMQRSEIQQV